MGKKTNIEDVAAILVDGIKSVMKGGDDADINRLKVASVATGQVCRTYSEKMKYHGNRKETPLIPFLGGSTRVIRQGKNHRRPMENDEDQKGEISGATPAPA